MVVMKIKKKKKKNTNKCVVTGDLKLQNYQNWLEEIPLDHKINHLEKNKINKNKFKKTINNS